MMVLHLLVLLLSCGIQAAGAQMKLYPETLTVLRGEEARFTCSASNTKWTVMLWLLNGTAAVTISKLHGVLQSPITNVTAEPVSGSKRDSWVFVLNSTERYNQGQVTCDLQGIDRKTANLFVQEKGIVKVSGDDKLAFKGKSVIFECRAAGWYPEPSLYWQVNDKKVSQAEYNISSEESGKSLFTVSSNLSVMAAKSSEVDCLVSVSALTTPLKSGVRLTVEVVQEDDDCTVPLAVTASLSALLLLLLLGICIVLCYRQRRQANPSPKEPSWFDQSVVGRGVVAEVTRGTDNLGYSKEGPTDHKLGKTSGPDADYNELIMEIRRQMDFASFHKVPDVVYFSSPSLHSESQGPASTSEENPVNVRRITTV
ncbi:immunoglobulin superfamily member 5 isoform X3 [Hippoglossus hippoglossus]|uniref:immunoglobulin superfamily member 5 isoform X3 n=1 Tax=Hippoglossus hippoglossus TaxID=8267 RepID=UPI00148D20FD|nr:immunoglobulin superfamily member 5 isoform X3 [Hippoglossus hippoglossus]